LFVLKLFFREANKLKSISPQIIVKTNVSDEKFIVEKPLENIKTSNDFGKFQNKDIFPEIEGFFLLSEIHILLIFLILENQSASVLQKSYCTCKKPYKEGELMIRCDYDQCEGWYHLECVGFKDKTEEEITKIKWYCSEECKEVKKIHYFLLKKII